ncbi:MAG TPA: SPOR domain-containing protein, partial [Azoarcus sp.]|nr:SPOR domain-containing protein [Azoarcus sp.]
EDPAAAATNARATAPITEIAQPFPLEAAPDAGPEADRQSILDNRLSASPERMAEAPAEESLIPPPISESGRHWLRADDFMPLTEAQELFAVARDAGYVGSILYRVVEGPFPARADMMQGDGQESIVVGQAGRWWRQFGLFAHKENAERFAEQLNQQGHDVVLQGQPEFGPYAHASDAEAGLAILRQMVERPFLAARIVAR